MPCALPQLSVLEFIPRLKVSEIQKSVCILHAPMDSFSHAGGVIFFGLLAIAFFHIKGIEKDHKLLSNALFLYDIEFF